MRVNVDCLRSNRTSEKVVLSFWTKCSKWKFVFHFFKAIFNTSFGLSRSLVLVVNATSGRNLPVLNFPLACGTSHIIVEANKRRFWTAYINRKWTSWILRQCFCPIGPIVSYPGDDGELRFVGHRPTRVRTKAEDLTETRNRAWKASGTQGTY